MLKRTILFASASLALGADGWESIYPGETVLTISPATQAGHFELGDDVGALNPHAYRPNEFVTNDFIFEGLVAWEPGFVGLDGITNTKDDFVAASLATSWTTTEAAHLADSSVPYEITFTLRPGVTFHDGAKWDAATAALNFDHIMGGPDRRLAGFHDWYGMPGAIASWAAVDAMTFKITFNSYYEAALRELTFIRPFRMTSPAALPSLADGEISVAAWRNGLPRTFGPYLAVGVKKPIGTGPYEVTHKLLTTGRTIMPADFNHTCHISTGGRGSGCVYPGTERLSEVHFKKFRNHRFFTDAQYHKPAGGATGYDRVVVKAYASHGAIKAALLDGTLDMAYGLNTLPPTKFIALATEEGDKVKAHTNPVLANTRTLVLNSAGALNTASLRKMVMQHIDRTALYEGELAEEQPMDTLFDPAKPYCNVPLTSIAALAATTTSTPADVTAPLRFIYMKDVPHHKIIASEVIADLYTHGINVRPIPLEKSAYNSAMNTWTGDDGDAYTVDADGSAVQSFDMALSATWGPPYDATSKLFDMTYQWGSGEADAVATSNLESITKSALNTLMLSLSTTTDKAARQAKYTQVLQTLHNEAVFLPLTAMRNLAVTSTNVSGFKFGYGEYDIPIAQLYPTPPPSAPSLLDSLSDGAIAAIAASAAIAGALLLCMVCMISKEKQGAPIFSSIDGKKGAPPTVAVQA